MFLCMYVFICVYVCMIGVYVHRCTYPRVTVAISVSTEPLPITWQKVCLLRSSRDSKRDVLMGEEYKEENVSCGKDTLSKSPKSGAP